MGFLAGKRLLITGVLNNRSIAYGIAKACHREGAELAFSYQGERFKDRITEFAAEFGSKLVFECDVGEDAQIDGLFAQLGEHWDQFDGFVHAIAYAPREAIAGDFLDGMTRENFRIAHDISAYSFPAMAKAALPRLRPGAELGPEVHIGNFVEVKKSVIGAQSKANHLAYIGDAEIGQRVNVGAGTITCNYDGANKWKTVIEDDVFIGSDTQLVAPVTVGRGATLGAGTTLTKDAPPDALTVSRPKQITLAGWARPTKIKK